MTNAMQRKGDLSQRRNGHRKSASIFAGTLAVAGTIFTLASTGGAQSPSNQPAPAQAHAAQRHSSLPKAALEKAQEAEKQLAANSPEKAIVILRTLDKEYPHQSAISLRLAQIYDTLGRNGYALFFYRRYISEAKGNPRDFAVERVRTLEMMAGIDAQVEKVENEFGEETRPVATPTPVIKRMLATTAKDGSLVPIRNEDDLNRITREGVPETSPETPVVATPRITPIILPDAHTPTPRTSPAAQQNADEHLTLDMNGTEITAAASGNNVSRKADEDALLAAAFRTADSPDEITEQSNETAEASSTDKVSGANPANLEIEAETPAPVAAEIAASPTPAVSIEPPPSLSSSGQATLSPPQLGSPDSASVIAFTKQTPANTGRAADFFHVTDAPGQYALVSLVHDVSSSMLTFTITPQDDGEVMSAILAPKEQKRVYVRPGTYTVTANVSTTDYSPITLMNTHFQYTFSAGKQYTRRFNKNTIQQLN